MKSMKQKLICIKLGGSVITDKKVAYSAKTETIKDIARALKKIKTPLIITHGSGSFGHTSAAKYCKKYGYTSKWGIAKVAFDAVEINRIVMKVFIEEKIPAVSFRPMSLFYTEEGKIKDSFFEPILIALKQGLIPILYGDVIWDSKLNSTIFSGETVLNKLCTYLQKDYDVENIIELCDVDGVLNKEGKVIPRINKKSWKKIQTFIKGSSSTDVTGGMKHKVEEAFNLAKSGISTNIIRGGNSRILVDAINKKRVGTIISL